MVVGAISSAFLLYAPSVIGLPGVWCGLTLFMGLRTVAGYMRYRVPDLCFLSLFLYFHISFNLIFLKRIFLSNQSTGLLFDFSFSRLLWKNGPWWFLQEEIHNLEVGWERKWIPSEITPWRFAIDVIVFVLTSASRLPVEMRSAGAIHFI